MPEMRARGCHREAAAAKERRGQGVPPRGRPVRIEARGGSGGPERRYAPSQTHTIGSASLVAAVAGSSGSAPPRAFRDDAA
jgi:hypothetical protein